jgi:urea transport system substrate-binding protein
MLMLIDEQNKKGGLLGKKLEAVVVDPASNWPLFAEKARELIAKDKVSAVFGCWTSVSRKSVLPVFKELNSILFYPVQYEGEESERNVFYTGAAPNQQAIPAVDYLAKEEKVQRWVLAGTDYVYPRTTNKILEAYLKAKGVAADDIMINYTPFGHSDWQTIVADIKKFGSAGKKTAVVSSHAFRPCCGAVHFCGGSARQFACKQMRAMTSFLRVDGQERSTCVHSGRGFFHARRYPPPAFQPLLRRRTIRHAM